MTTGAQPKAKGRRLAKSTRRVTELYRGCSAELRDTSLTRSALRACVRLAEVLLSGERNPAR